MDHQQWEPESQEWELEKELGTRMAAQKRSNSAKGTTLNTFLVPYFWST